jgi:hypothetical protein
LKRIREHYRNYPQQTLVLAYPDSQDTRELHLSPEQVKDQFESVLPIHKDDKGFWDVFISYRRSDHFDTNVASTLWNSLGLATIGKDGQRIMTFLDSQSLTYGQQFDTGFMNAMAESLVVTPIITPQALEGMCSERSLQEVDNVLLEWWLALTLHKRTDLLACRHIYPLFFGDIRMGTGDDSIYNVQNLFKDFPWDKLPEKRNEPTYSRLNRFLKDNLGWETEAEPLTVRGIVDQLRKFNSQGLGWDIFQRLFPRPKENFMRAAQIQIAIERMTAECVKYIQQPVGEARDALLQQLASESTVEEDSQRSGSLARRLSGKPSGKGWQFLVDEPCL